MKTYDCKLTFNTRRDAKSFAELFAERFSHGYDLGFENQDKSNDLNIYGMEKEQLDWVKNLNGF
jgi:hypothetical protein